MLFIDTAAAASWEVWFGMLALVFAVFLLCFRSYFMLPFGYWFLLGLLFLFVSFLLIFIGLHLFGPLHLLDLLFTSYLFFPLYPILFEVFSCHLLLAFLLHEFSLFFLFVLLQNHQPDSIYCKEILLTFALFGWILFVMRLDFVIKSENWKLFWLHWQLMLVIDLWLANWREKFSAETVSFVILIYLS